MRIPSTRKKALRLTSWRLSQQKMAYLHKLQADILRDASSREAQLYLCTFIEVVAEQECQEAVAELRIFRFGNGCSTKLTSVWCVAPFATPTLYVEAIRLQRHAHHALLRRRKEEAIAEQIERGVVDDELLEAIE